MTPFLAAYFTRVGWSDSVNANAEALQALHLLRNTAIPSENLNVSLPREIQLNDLSLEEKLVTARRGGYCSEQNGVSERALRRTGFSVRGFLSRVVPVNSLSLPPHIYRLLLVELQGEQWIADVGFGGQALTAPIRLQVNTEQKTLHGEYRLTQEGKDWVLQFRYHGHWQSMYRFDLVVQHQGDYPMGSFWSTHWSQSHFRHHLLVCRHLPNSRKLTLTNFRFIHYQDEHAVEQISLSGIVSLYASLQEQFGLDMDDMKHGFTEDELAMIVATFDAHPEAGRWGHRKSCRMQRHRPVRSSGTIRDLSPILRETGSPPNRQ